MDTLEKELLEMIVKICRVNIQIQDDFDTSSPLIGPESLLGIDSLDAVEIVYSIQNNYKLRIDSEERSREVLSSLKSLAEFVRNGTEQS